MTHYANPECGDCGERHAPHSKCECIDVLLGQNRELREELSAAEKRAAEAEDMLAEYRLASKQLGSNEMFTGMSGAARLKILDALSALPARSAAVLAVLEILPRWKRTVEADCGCGSREERELLEAIRNLDKEV